MRTYNIDSFSYQERDRVLPRLLEGLSRAGAYIVGRPRASGCGVELAVEFHPRAGVEVYCALAAEGIELSRAAQRTLLAVCDERSYAGRGSGAAGEVLSIRLVVRFLDDAPIATLLTRSNLIV